MTPRTASDYWRLIDEAWAAHVEVHSHDMSGGAKTQDLISEAIQAGVVGHQVDVGDGRTEPLSSLVAPFRTVPGGMAERNEAEKSRLLNRPYGGKKWEGW